ncbi:ATP-dependent RNA helicase DED1-like [Drosophila subpulchrella]|uniref:ATP-dependent RNA helicase DED1-like n=1 Tax=Drosophila subpulchrella TaxID=1486046 RepID=UPI0018A130B1|nr:ATP-dependent RNA helicase DED1-like [Drosophila subpulchrella]
MSVLRCLLFLIFGALLLRNAASEDNKSQDDKEQQHHLPDEVKNLDESVERIRRQIGAFGYGVGVFGGRHLAPIGNPYYGGQFGNPYFVQPYGHYFHDRRFGGNYGGGFAGNFYGR